MNPNLERGLLLYQQSRYDLAEQELRQALAADPDDAYSHALLALCLTEQKEFKDATEEAHRAVHQAPDDPFSHYALARVFYDRDRPDEAVAAISESIRLDPADADYQSLLAAIRFDQRRWQDALTAAEQGLQNNSEHVGCTNLRAMALVKLGRRQEAGATIDAALAKNPENAITHANQGWTLLEKRDPQKALEHFREALRLDPGNEWARHGIVEALKARNVIYGLMLRYFLWMSKLSPAAQWGVILGGYFLNRMLGTAAKSSPDLAPWLLPVRILFFGAVVLTWTADPLFNLLLRVNRFGRLALSREQMVASTWFGVCVLLALMSLAFCLPFGVDSPFVVSAAVFGLLMIPVAGMFKASSGWPRTLLMTYTGLLALVGIGALALVSVETVGGADAVGGLRGVWKGALGAFATGCVIFMWGANVIIPIRPKK
ncbi:MAG TPA: tetratricopeptide repeat protein [Verrucomicrobiae bacterium]|nr:tetratricopeptide repeat protein [Verrucomicrobiae bacterium]